MERHPSSFRDDAGYLFWHDGVLYRAVCEPGLEDYRALMGSGLHAELVQAGQIVPHEDADGIPPPGEARAVLRPQLVPFISYPYEWCFSQLRDAALLTLDIQKKALHRGLSLKDASFFNVQFIGARPVFIDTLSFERRRDVPWVAYRQFCEHFLGPLAVMSMTWPEAHGWLAGHLDGLALRDACRLLPFRARLSAGRLMHLYLHAASQRKHESGGDGAPGAASRPFSLVRQLALVDSLSATVSRLAPPRARTEWGDYVEEARHYTTEAEQLKKTVVERAATEVGRGRAWDLGGNTGTYSRIAAQQGMYAVCLDGDHRCIERAYAQARQDGTESFLPLLQDLSNPSPPAGWAHRERLSLAQRGPADLLIALAVVHHLRVTANIPFRNMIGFFAEIGRRAIVEFVPKEDPMTRRIIGARKDIFHDYDQGTFESLLAERFDMLGRLPVPGTPRTLYDLRRR